jgi:sugar-specific transcriptional regulator TrmB
LLKESPATGYEVAAKGAIPRSAIYGVLRQLFDRGIVNEVPGKPVRYIPLPPERLLHHLTSRFGEKVQRFNESLDAYKENTQETPTWSLRGAEQIETELRRVIESAQESLVASLWASDGKRLEQDLRDATDKGVRISTFSFTPISFLPGATFSYDFAEEELSKHWPKRVLLIADRTSMVVGTWSGSSSDRATYTEDPSLLEMAVANLTLDLTLLGERKDVAVDAVIDSLRAPVAPIDALLRS